MEGLVGERNLAQGVEAPFRQGPQGDLIGSMLHGKWVEQAKSGRLYIVSTAVGGVAPGTVLSTTPPMAIWNPTGSGVLAAILETSFGYVSGTLGAGTLVHAYASGQALAPTGGTELQVISGKISATGGKARAFQGSTLANTPLIIRPGITLGAKAAATALESARVVDEVGGQIIIPEGMCYVLQAVAAAGSTPLGMLGVLFEEIPA